MKIRIIKKHNLEDTHYMKKFYEYLKLRDIEIVYKTEECDLIVTFGGDGTILEAAQAVLVKDVPILAVNMGSLGYLACIRDSEAIYILEKFLENDYKIEKRNFLKINYNGDYHYALNELVIAKGGIKSSLIEISVYAESELINKYRADGIIVATPTGSTAYSLSAGGPIVHPALNSILLTPLSPQSLTTRAVVLDGDKMLSFNLESRENDIHLNIDGKTHFKIHKQDKIETKLSRKGIRLIKSESRDYFQILREKLKWGDSFKI